MRLSLAVDSTTSRILVSLMGLATAALSATGVGIWYRKRRARVRAAQAAMVRGEGATPEPA